jgi:uncharacterized phage-associated protein
MYSPKQIADFFLFKGQTDANMTTMKLIKLVYIAHGWRLGLYNEVLITESPQAWKYGPVIPSLYDEFRKFGNKKIDIEIAENPIKDEELTKFLDKIWDTYKDYSALQLSAMTHESGTPWSITWEKAKQQASTFNLTIPDNLIRDNYDSKRAQTA